MTSGRPDQTWCVRAARADECVHLPALERSAAQLFRQIPALSYLAEGGVLPESVHLACHAQGTCWVVTAEQGTPVAFLSAQVCATELHILEMSVAAKYQGQGVGRALLLHACAWARQHQLDAVTLTTFRNVPWNGPFYAKLGFKLVPEGTLSPRLQALLQEEVKHGFKAEERCAMQLRL